MNPWPFVISAYAITLIATIALSVQAWIAMRNAEGTGK